MNTDEHGRQTAKAAKIAMSEHSIPLSLDPYPQSNDD